MKTSEMNLRINPADPRSAILAIVGLARQICLDTGRDPADALMILMTAAVQHYRTYAQNPADRQMMVAALLDAFDAAEGWWQIEKERLQ